MRKVRGLMETAAKRFRLPEELLDGTARLTLSGGSSVRIENHKCLLSYSPEMLEVACGRQRIRVRGEGLQIRCMDRAELLLEGRIMAVEVESG